LDPGILATEITRKREGDSFFIGALIAVLRTTLKLVGIYPDVCAKALIHCATHPDIPSQAGSYFK